MLEFPFKKRKRSALATRCEQLQPCLYRIARAWGCERDLACELVQETLLRALQNLEQLREPKSLQSWLVCILVNNYRAHVRRSRTLTALDVVELMDTREPASELERARAIDRVRRAIDMLSDDHRHVITLVDMEGMSYAEVAQALDIRIGTVMSRISRGRARLRQLLQDVLTEETTSGPDSTKHLWKVK